MYPQHNNKKKKKKDLERPEVLYQQERTQSSGNVF
jgi:hypothetical protein